MSKRNLLNLFLFTFILALLAVVVFEPGKKVEVTPATLTKLKANDISHIRIKNSGNREIELIKKDNSWSMLQPYQLPANAFRIEPILKLVSAVSFSQNNLSSLNPAEFGLNKPIAIITFNKKTKIIFGHNKSLKNYRYVQIGDVLHLMADTFYYKLAANAESFIDHKLLPAGSKISQLILPTLKLKNIDGNWETTPNKNSFSADSINQLIGEWRLSQAYDIKIKDIAKNTKADIRIEFKNNSPLRFKIENNKDDFSLTNLDTGVSYILSKDRKDKLLKLSPIEQAEIE